MTDGQPTCVYFDLNFYIISDFHAKHWGTSFPWTTGLDYWNDLESTKCIYIQILFVLPWINSHKGLSLF